ncbi:MAG: hybrid sensor histidine kinase/response regulator, partial [Anaerolineae bacterium]|nr:hybrid sensor histidine kinase/response regulator [Anaerolineae bacterium]NIQ79362.1 hybrid sensor histidine kinase/response regulator [Anaerolineae bacterium]
LTPRVRANLEKVTAEAERAARIVQNLLTFARQRKPDKQPVSINNLIRLTLDLRAYHFRVNNIEVVEEFDANLPDAAADPY